ncbi:substrate-binding domain-containing protein [Halobacteriovorax sp. HLS]|uniref:substrate-binding domain-containing protein n=1 Tax=Halobacteriovorax sp. HLS TaxID=2234000 RepID=UPI000FDC0768|nr:substrate-binding domain-containing protein [Halobacteriovorax sp. HLS]
MKVKLIFLFFCISLNISSKEKIYKFAIIAKNSEQKFYKEVQKGCERRAAELKNVECIFPKTKSANHLVQERILMELYNSDIDGIAMAVINSDYTEKSLEKYLRKDVPLITFDADFSKKVLTKNQTIRKAYIGTNNYQLGKTLAELFYKDKPIPKEYCVLSGNRIADNLNQRVKGFVETLTKLDKKKYYIHNERCPVYSYEKSDKSLSFFRKILRLQTEDKLVPSVIIMGTIAQEDEAKFRAMITESGKKKSELNIYSIDTIQNQLNLLKDGYLKGLVGQKPEEMGSRSIDLLFSIKKGVKVKELNYTDLNICTRSNYLTCTKSSK